MQKAVMVKMHRDVEELNKLFDEGYVVDSVDDNGVYILNKENNIKKSDINTEITAYVPLDTNRSQRGFDLLGKTVKQIKDDEHVVKQPHVRIEFDDIRYVPKVWVDGELIGGVDDKPLVSLKVDWNTDMDDDNHKVFDVDYYDVTGERPMSRGIREGTSK